MGAPRPRRNPRPGSEAALPVLSLKAGWGMVPMATGRCAPHSGYCNARRYPRSSRAPRAHRLATVRERARLTVVHLLPHLVRDGSARTITNLRPSAWYAFRVLDDPRRGTGSGRYASGAVV